MWNLNLWSIHHLDLLRRGSVAVRYSSVVISMVQAALSGLRVNADADRKINSCLIDLIENWVETAGARQI